MILRRRQLWFGLVLVLAMLVALATELVSGETYSCAAPESTEEITMRDDDVWRDILDSAKYRVLRKAGTERPFTGEYYETEDEGVYRCGACGAPLFASDDKYHSGSGWPSFVKPARGDAIAEREDVSHGMRRTEAICSRCGSHLGHVFPDGPAPTGLRYCINSASLALDRSRKSSEPIAPAPQSQLQQIVFGAGCFWGVEAAFRRIDGVVETAVGYSGGHTERPSYRQVCTGTTGHAEVVLVTFDPGRVSLQDLLQTFWKIHNPTTRNRQGPDVGSQYRSAIFTFTEEQREAVEASRRAEQESGHHRGEITTEIAPVGTFWRAEEYHQRYHEKHGGDACAG